MGASDIHQRLNEYLAYFTLAYGLHRTSDGKLDSLRDLIQMVESFISTASAGELKKKGQHLATHLEGAIKEHAKFLPRKAPVRQIARDFNLLCLESDVWRYGIPYGWLTERFESSALRQPPDLPSHAKVGIGVHAGNASVEEIFLLDDTFFLLARAELAFDLLQAEGNNLRKLPNGHFNTKQYRNLATLNGDVCTFSRLSVVSSAAFVEAFVNSVGWGEANQRKDLSEEVREQLRGTVKGRYLGLETKLERFPRLIRLDGISPIILSDSKQIKEPFTSFLAETKEVRDASMHYAPGKARIWLPPHDWLSSAQRATEHAVGVAQAFWKACYPQKELPRYLDQLNYSRFLERARARARQTNDSEEDK